MERRALARIAEGIGDEQAQAVFARDKIHANKRPDLDAVRLDANDAADLIRADELAVDGEREFRTDGAFDAHVRLRDRQRVSLAQVDKAGRGIERAEVRVGVG